MKEKITYRLEDYDYQLPKNLIADRPSDKRHGSRLMVLYRKNGRTEHVKFSDIVNYLDRRDLLVLNDTRVVKARLFARKPSGGRVEILVLDPFRESDSHECLVKSSKPVQKGMELTIENSGGKVRAIVVETYANGKASVVFKSPMPLLEMLNCYGFVPLPPYILKRRSFRGEADFDSVRYQTVYGVKPGAIAAPTAGFHFSKELLGKLRQKKNIRLAFITLHVSYGTFAPIRTEDIRLHDIHSEWCEVPHETALAVKEVQRSGGRVIAVGTTVVRTLEWVATIFGEVRKHKGYCNHYIYPGYEFKVVDAMITNFHLPKSSLILLVCAFAGRENILRAYREAIEKKYRFYSYGDAMLIL